MIDFDSEYAKLKSSVDEALQACLPNPGESGSGQEGLGIHEAMRYSLFAGGKRLRPVLSLAAANIAGISAKAVMPYACAVEMIHTYSLIHDDLPAMDNDDFRRGKPSCHKAFGEATAVLAGDALLNRAFEIMLDDISGPPPPAPQDKAKAAALIAAASGAGGMIGGQMEDIRLERRPAAGNEVKAGVNAQMLERMHMMKTGMLIKASILSPLFLSGGSKENHVPILSRYSDKLGLAFQIRDDMLDVSGEPELIGKSAGKDSAAGKVTYVSVYGYRKAGEMLAEVTEEAVNAAGSIGNSGEFLAELARRMSLRKC